MVVESIKLYRGQRWEILIKRGETKKILLKNSISIAFSFSSWRFRNETIRQQIGVTINNLDIIEGDI